MTQFVASSASNSPVYSSSLSRLERERSTFFFFPRSREREGILFARTPESFVFRRGWIRCGEEGRLGLAARTFTCLDHSAGTMASAKQPVVTRD